MLRHLRGPLLLLLAFILVAVLIGATGCSGPVVLDRTASGGDRFELPVVEWPWGRCTVVKDPCATTTLAP